MSSTKEIVGVHVGDRSRVAQLQFMFKERGAKNAIAIASFVVLFAFSLGYLLNQLLTIMELSF